MNQQTPTAPPEVDLNPHSDLPAGGVISTEISPAAVAPEQAAELKPLPFGVYLGTCTAVAPDPVANV